MKFFKSLHKVICNLTPYFALAAFALLVVIFIGTQKMKRQIDEIENNVDYIERSVSSMDFEYDNSDVIQAISDAVYDIEGEIDAAKSDIETTVMIWR